MISMSKAYSIRQLRMMGCSIAEIARKTEVSRDTVYKYLAKEDFSEHPPQRRSKPKILDPYRPLIESWLDEDRKSWHKQRHTAHRIWVRLREEGVDVGESTVRRYVHELKKDRSDSTERYLDLDWAPGEAQADFGEAEFFVLGTKKRLSYFVLSFPYSNVGLVQVFPGENAECVCQALKNIFEYVKGVPTRIVFDNATGVGRRVGESIRTTKMFSAFAAHYGFAFSFCNPASGHEKGNVEKKVGYIRNNLFVPVPRFRDPMRYNKRLLDKSMRLSDKKHWLKGENELQLFVEDSFALIGLPQAPFSVIRYEMHKADKLGKVKIDGMHLYSSDPSLAGRDLVCGLGATNVTIATEDGTVVATHARAYGQAPTDTTDPASQLALLCTKAGAWQNSTVRSALPEELRDHMDSLDKQGLRAELRIMRDQAVESGWDTTVEAMRISFLSTGRIDRASIAVSAARIKSGAVVYDEPVDLGIYDRALQKEGC